MDKSSTKFDIGLDDVLAEFLEAEEIGRPDLLEDLIARHPQFADDLREFLADRAALRSAARPLADAVVTREPVHGRIRYFGDYELLEEIARGGMGVVYKARQVSLNRIVAVKMILAGHLASEVDIQRFQTEAEAAARLQHPNIVSVHEVGRHEGQSYFSMDFVEGNNLAEIVRDRPLRLRSAAEYVAQIAEAVHYAHQQGTLHRDLKPSNVLIDQSDRVRITDFGLASNVESESHLTKTGQALGTPAYMPPEQAQGKRGLIGPGSDVYALGAILYELVAGRPPFRGESPVETLRQVIDDEPLSPRLLNPSVPRDVETICMKCLEKEPHKRYASAGSLADELRRFLNSEPIAARPVGRAGRSWRWCKRKPLAAGLAGALLLTVVATVITLAVANVKINQALNDRTDALAQAHADKKAAEKALERQKQAVAAQNRLTKKLRDTLERTQWNAYLRGILLSVKDGDAGNLAGARMRLATCEPQTLRGFEWHYLASRFRRPLIVEWSNRALRPPRALTAAGLAIAEVDGELHVYDPVRRRVVFKQPVPMHEYAHAISPDGRWVAFVTRRSIRRTIRIRSVVVDSKRPTIQLPPENAVQDVLFSGDGRRVLALVELSESKKLRPNGIRKVTRRVSVIKTFDATNAKLIATHRLAGLPSRRQTRYRSLIAADGDLRRLLTPTALFDLQSSKTVRTISEPAEAVALNRDASYAAVATNAGKVTVWNVATGKPVDSWTTAQRVWQIAFRPNASEVALGCADGTLAFRDFRIRRSLAPMPTGSRIRSLAFLPGGQHLLTAHFVRGTLRYRVWKRNRDACLVVSPSRLKSSNWGRQVCFRPDGKSVAIVGENGTVHLLNARTGELIRTLQAGTRVHNQLASVAIAPDGKTITAAGRDGFFVWDVKSGRLHRRLQPDVGTFCTQAAFSRDGRLLAGAHQDGVTVWDWTKGRVEKRLRSRGCEFGSIGFSSNGAFLFATANLGRSRILNVADWSLRCRLSDPRGYRGVLSPDDKRLAIPAGSEIRFYDTSSGKPLPSMKLPGRAGELSFSPDGKRLAATSGNRVLVFDTKTGDLVLTLSGHKRRISTLAFSPDGRRLVSAAEGGSLRIWGEPADAK